MNKIFNINTLYKITEDIIYELYDDYTEPYYGFIHYNTPAIDNIGNHYIDSLSFTLDDIMVEYEAD